MSAWCLLKALASTWVEFAGAGSSDSLPERPERQGGRGQLNERLSFMKQSWLNAGLILLTCSVVG